jgi:CheY-like chemotaxis protein
MKGDPKLRAVVSDEDTGGIGLPPRAPASLAGLRILLVDDDADARDLLTLALQQSGAEVTAVTSTEAAMESIVRWHPHVLVSDIGLPGQDGFALIRQVRSLRPEQGGTTPAIALTAYASPEDRQRAAAAGFQLHVSKPVEPSRLIETIGQLARPRPSNEVASA